MNTTAAFITTDLSRVRLWGERGALSWNAEGGAANGSGDSGGATLESVRARVGSAANWTAEQSAVGKRIGLVCVDVEEALCLWLKAPSKEPAAVVAAARAACEDWGGTLPVGTLEGLWAQNSGEKSRGSKAGLWSTLRQPVGGGSKERGAAHGVVLSIPDATARLWLDGLDERGVRADRVLTLWHALAAAWGGGETEEQRSDLVAVLAIEEDHRVTWAWARGSELVVGGVAALPKASRARESASEDEARASEAAAETDAAERRGQTAARLSMDWLTWATHLSATPTRVVMVGPNEQCAALAAALGSAWPAANRPTIAASADPIGETLVRVAEKATEGDDDVCARRGLVRLTRRPSRALRTRYRWGAVAMALLALALAGLAYRIQGAAAKLRVLAAETRTQVSERVSSLNDPLLAGARDPVMVLQSKLAELRSKESIRLPEGPRPIHGELLRALDVLTQYDKARLTQVVVDTRQSSTLSVMTPDRRTSEEITVKIEQLGGTMSWRSSRSGSDQSLRFTGTWTRFE